MKATARSNLRVSTQHRTESHERPQVAQHLDEWHTIPPSIIVAQCSSPHRLFLITMPPTVLLDALAQLLQLHVHASHVCLANRGMNFFAAL